MLRDWITCKEAKSKRGDLSINSGVDSGHFIESFPRGSVLLADLKKITSGIGNCSLGSYCLVVTQANHCSEFSMPKHPIANNQLIRHFRIEKGTGTAHLFLGSYW